MKKAIAILSVGAASLALAAGAFAHGRSHPSTLRIDGSDVVLNDPSLIFVAGRVQSPSSKCIKGRTVKVAYRYAGDFEPVDVAKSGKSGAFSVVGPTVDNNGVQADAAKLKLKETSTCGGDKLLFT